jgi:allantoate deiminase
MVEASMAAGIDDAGTVSGRYEGNAPGLPALLLGSHIDTVRNAGRFDGTLGVLVAIAVVGMLAEKSRRLPFAIEVLAFGDEEGVRFPTTLAGSRAVSGKFDETSLEECDADGVTLRQALTNFGCEPLKIRDIVRRPADVLGYIEVHIEQGTVLEEAGQAVALVSGISGAMRLSLHVEGESGHAGTLPMKQRRDALCGAAEMVLAIELMATRSNIVATVGRLSASPGAVNVVAGAANFTLDIRAQDDDVRRAVLADILGQCAVIAKRRGLTLRDEVFYDMQTTFCDPGLMARLGEAMARQDIPPIEIASGAGHDGLAIVNLCPIAMLFVRCKDGISHRPEEYVSPEDIETATAVLFDTLIGFTPCDSGIDLSALDGTSGA